MTDKKTKANNPKKQQLTGFIILLVAIAVVNILSESLYRRFDLTKEKRFTISPATKKLINKLDDVVYFNIYLEGDFPNSYKRLRNASRDMLEEFRRASDGNVEYIFEDVFGKKEIQEKEEIMKQLVGKGLEYTTPEIEADQASSDKFIIPGGMVYYKGIEYPINLLKRDFGKKLEDEINGSIEMLEYEIGNVIRKCVAGKEVRIAFTVGHGELPVSSIVDIAKELSNFYRVEKINLNLNDTDCISRYASRMLAHPNESEKILLNGVLNDLKSYKGLVVAKPREHFSSTETFLLDQYVMSGGKVIWLVESLIAEMDSVAKYGAIMTANYDIGLDDIFFKYGVRINPTLIQDLNCHGIPVMDKKGSGRPGFLPWIFYPLFSPDGQHPIVRNLTSVWGQFVGTIDTIPRPYQKKHILLHSSEQSRVAYNPVSVSMNQVSMNPNPALFIKGNQMAAVLLEGQFKSPFEYRPGFQEKTIIPFKPETADNDMIFIADGDIIANQKSSRGEVFPLGYDRFASQYKGEPVSFANKKFFLNCVDYLCDESNLIEVRNKEIVLRLLDRPRVKDEKFRWQVFNMLLPIILLLVFGFINSFVRKRKYAK